MKNRFRIEIYDDIKANDLTIFADNNVDRELLSEYVFGNIRNFNTTVHAYVFDTLKKKKTAAMFLPMETVQSIKSKMSYTSNILA
jgi:transcriptional regulator with AAA-type ATPase domain